MEVFVVGQLPDEASFFFAHCSLALPETVRLKIGNRIPCDLRINPSQLPHSQLPLFLLFLELFVSDGALTAEAEALQVLVKTGIDRGMLQTLAETFSFSSDCSCPFLFFPTW